MKIVVVGGAGFIGSRCTEKLLESVDNTVTVFDNFSSGREWHLANAIKTGRLAVVRGDAQDLGSLVSAMQGASLVYHFASNPDIAKAATEPTIDFFQGTLLSQNVFEAARLAKVAGVIYASGSGVFGDDASQTFTEESFSCHPPSTYAASKAAGETLLSAYAAMFGLKGMSYRFANVVGPHQTHGVAYDFIRRLRKDPTKLVVMGNGFQTKSYIHVDDIVAALTHFGQSFPAPYSYFNLSTPDALTVRQIAEMVIEEMGLSGVDVVYGTSARGWAGDVPIIRFSCEKIQSYGWKPKRTSHQAMQASIRGMIENERQGLFA